MKTSTLLIEHSLLPYHAASNIMRELAKIAPTFHHWLEHTPATKHAFDPFMHGCTSLEFEVLKDLGFTPPVGTPMGTGLASLLNTEEANQSVIHLGSISIGSQSIGYIHGVDLMITQDESLELLKSSKDLFEAHGMTVQLLTPERWLITGHLPQHHASIDMLLDEGIEYCWPKANDTKPWRRLVNEVQMLWHKHAVNKNRLEHGQDEINTIWLQGGCSQWEPRAKHYVSQQTLAHHLYQCTSNRTQSSIKTHPVGEPNEYIIEQSLSKPHRKNNWAEWLNTLRQLDIHTFSPLQQALKQGRIEQLDIVLCSSRQQMKLCVKSRNKLLSWLPQKKQDWRTWWLDHA